MPLSSVLMGGTLTCVIAQVQLRLRVPHEHRRDIKSAPVDVCLAGMQQQQLKLSTRVEGRHVEATVRPQRHAVSHQKREESCLHAADVHGTMHAAFHLLLSHGTALLCVRVTGLQKTLDVEAWIEGYRSASSVPTMPYFARLCRLN